MVNKRHIDDKQDIEINKNRFIITILFVIILIFLSLLAMDRFGILSADSGEQIGKADLICFMSGYPGGVDIDLFVENKSGYYFKCSNDIIDITFNKDTGVGFIGHKKYE